MQREKMRLNRYIADSGLCSRRQADRLIAEARVLVNGQVASLGQQIKPGYDVVKVDQQVIEARDQSAYVYLAFNKPYGITCTTDRRRRDNIIDYIAYPQRIYPIGRLDRDSEGLILLTNDGSIVNKILRVENQQEKEYLVEVDRAYDDVFIQNMQKGVKILGTTTLPAGFKRTGAKNFRLTIRQGLNRQIRRMCSALGYEVTFLRRLRIMNINLGNLPSGKYREIRPKELRDLKALLENSVEN